MTLIEPLLLVTIVETYILTSIVLTYILSLDPLYEDLYNTYFRY